MGGGMLMPLANSLQFFNGSKTTTVYEAKREISALDMRHPFIVIGEKASPGQLISAVLLDTRNLSKAKVFNYQKSQISLMAVSGDG